MTGPEIVTKAWEEFDAWVEAQSDEVQAMDILDHIDLYAREASE